MILTGLKLTETVSICFKVILYLIYVLKFSILINNYIWDTQTIKIYNTIIY